MSNELLKNKTDEQRPNAFDVFDVSNYFINLASESRIDENVSEGITNLKLQKLLYFAQSAYLSLYERELFEDEILAWQYGPVISSVYYRFKKYTNNNLELPEDYNNTLPQEIVEFLDGIWEMFSKYSARELVNITHSHKPWSEAYKKGAGTIIQKKILADYYKGIFKFQEDGEASA